jgi:hypothetical protein
MNRSKRPIIALLIAAISFFALSCSKDDPQPADPEDEAVGDYTYTVDIRRIELDKSQTFVDNFTGSMTAVKTGYSLVFSVPEGRFFTAEEIKRSSKGFSFDITTGLARIDQETIVVKGYDSGVTVDGATYSGQFISSTKKLTAVMTFQFQGYDYIYTVTGNLKQ